MTEYQIIQVLPAPIGAKEVFVYDDEIAEEPIYYFGLIGVFHGNGVLTEDPTKRFVAPLAWADYGVFEYEENSSSCGFYMEGNAAQKEICMETAKRLLPKAAS